MKDASAPITENVPVPEAATPPELPPVLKKLLRPAAPVRSPIPPNTVPRETAALPTRNLGGLAALSLVELRNRKRIDTLRANISSLQGTADRVIAEGNALIEELRRVQGGADLAASNNLDLGAATAFFADLTATLDKHFPPQTA